MPEQQMTAYQLAQIQLANKPSLTRDELAIAQQEIEKWLYNSNTNGVKYFFLICKEVSYTTVFAKNPLNIMTNFKTVTSDIFECVKVLGSEIKDIEYEEDQDLYLIWIKDYTDTIRMIMLIASNEWVIEF